jgi:hypothetical protein
MERFCVRYSHDGAWAAYPIRMKYMMCYAYPKVSMLVYT